MTDELKPCPFCGRSGAILDEPLNEDEYGCFCNAHCGAIGPCDEDGEKAMEFWNTRPLEDAAIARAEKAEARADRYEQALHEIDTWAKAYPLDVFPEPDFKQVREVLSAAGIAIDQVSASNMRHVITGVARIVENALKGGER